MAATETTACAQVFAVAELLENILLALPPKDLLLSQRTCSAFRACVAESPSLQRRLYFRIQKEVAEDYIGDLDDFNSMLVRNDDVNSSLRSRLRVTINGISQVHFEPDAHDFEISAFMVWPFETEQVLGTVETGKASYLEMYLQQSPANTEIRVVKGSMYERRARVDWTAAYMVVEASAVRVLLELTVALKRAAEQLEDIEDEKKQWDLNADENRTASVGRPNRTFEWKYSFTQAQLGRVLSEPEIHLSDL